MQVRYDPRLRMTASGRIVVEIVATALRPGHRRRDLDGEACPVQQDRPLNLSGGAAAALEFGD